MSVARLIIGALVAADPLFDEERSADLRLAVSEACTNAIQAEMAGHVGQPPDPDAEPIVMRCVLADGQIEVAITDHGGGFDPSGLEAHPDVTSPDRLNYEGGLGIPLIKMLADHLEFQPTENGTTVVMRFDRRGPRRPPGHRRRERLGILPPAGSLDPRSAGKPGRRRRSRRPGRARNLMESPTVGTSPDLPQTWIESEHPLARALGRPLQSFLAVEAGGGIMLVVATVVALVWANSPWSAAYDTFFHTRVVIDIGSFSYDESLVHVINDGLMTLFFFVVGLEIKREWVAGELRDRRRPPSCRPSPRWAAWSCRRSSTSALNADGAGGSERLGHPDGHRHRLRPGRRRRPRQPGAAAR